MLPAFENVPAMLNATIRTTVFIFPVTGDDRGFRTSISYATLGGLRLRNLHWRLVLVRRNSSLLRLLLI